MIKILTCSMSDKTIHKLIPTAHLDLSSTIFLMLGPYKDISCALIPLFHLVPFAPLVTPMLKFWGAPNFANSFDPTRPQVR